MNRIQLKYKRPTEKELGHTQVILNDNIIGYFLPQNSIRKGDTYHLTIDNLDGEYFAEYFKSRKDVIKFLNNKFNY